MQRRVALVSSHLAYDGEPARDVNLSVPMLASWLEARKGGQYSVDVMNIEQILEVGDVRFSNQAADNILESAPDVVGLSCWLWDVDAMLDLSQRIRAADRDVMIVAGGPAATARAESILAENPQIDVVVRGEGEVPLAAMLEGDLENLDGIPGLAFRKKGGHIYSSPPFYFNDLSMLPSPFARGLVNQRSDSMFIEVARGCSNRCAYCHRTDRPKKVRLFPIKRLEEDVRWARDRGIKVIRLVGLPFKPNSKRLRRIAAMIQEIYFDKEYQLMINMDLMPPTTKGIESISHIPFDIIRCSVNTIHPQTLKVINRKNPELVGLKQLLRALSSISMVGVDVMMGLPGDNFEKFKATLDWVLETNRDVSDTIWEIVINWVIAVPGSPLGDDPSAFGIQKVNTPGIPYVLETESYSFDDIQRSIEYAYTLKKDANIVLKGLECAKISTEFGSLLSRFSPSNQSSELSGPSRYHGAEEVNRQVLSKLHQAIDGQEASWHYSESFEIDDGVGFRFVSDGFRSMDVVVALRDDRMPAYARTKKLNLSYVPDGRAPDLVFLVELVRLLEKGDG